MSATDGDRTPEQAEQPLDRTDIQIFRDEIILPAVDVLMRRPFCLAAEAGSQYNTELLVPLPSGVLGKSALQAVVYLDFDEGGADATPDRVCGVTVSCERVVPELLGIFKDLFAVYSEGVEGDAGTVNPWVAHRYAVSTQGPTMLKTTLYELRELEDDSVVWSPDEELEDDDAWNSEKGKKYDEARKPYRTARPKTEIFDRDTARILAALADLGVPTSILFP